MKSGRYLWTIPSNVYDISNPNLEFFDQRKQEHSIDVEVLSPTPFDEKYRFLGGIEHMPQTDTIIRLHTGLRLRPQRPL